MVWPLEDDDPRQLGAYRLTGRLRQEAAGVVYRAHGPGGRPASVALLAPEAAADPAARERFLTAVRHGTGVDGAPPVLAARTRRGPLLWVACPEDDEPEGAGAAAYLAPASLAEVSAAAPAVPGPAYRPYWESATPGRLRSGPWAAWAGLWPRRPDTQRTDAGLDSRTSGLLVALLILAAAIVVLLLVLLLWILPRFAETPQAPAPQEAQESERPQPEDAEQGEETEPSPDPVPEVDVDQRDLELFERDGPGDDPSDLG